jgi:hypothetical protein
MKTAEFEVWLQGLQRLSSSQYTQLKYRLHKPDARNETVKVLEQGTHPSSLCTMRCCKSVSLGPSSGLTEVQVSSLWPYLYPADWYAIGTIAA